MQATGCGRGERGSAALAPPDLVEEQLLVELVGLVPEGARDGVEERSRALASPGDAVAPLRAFWVFSRPPNGGMVI